MYPKNLHRVCKLLIQQPRWLRVDDTHCATAKVQDRSKRKRLFITRTVKSPPFLTKADPAEGKATLAAPGVVVLNRSCWSITGHMAHSSSGRQDHQADRGKLNYPPLLSKNKQSWKKIIIT